MSEKKTWADVHEGEVFTDNSQIEYCNQCKDCVFRDERGHERAVCMIYENPGHKPLQVINNTGLCPYYDSENEDAE